MNNSHLVRLGLIASIILNTLLAIAVVIILVVFAVGENKMIVSEDGTVEPLMEEEKPIEENTVEAEVDTPTVVVTPTSKTYSGTDFSAVSPMTWFVTAQTITSYDLDKVTNGSGGFVNASQATKCDVFLSHNDISSFSVVDYTVLSTTVTRERHVPTEPGPGSDQGELYYKVTNGSGKKLAVSCSFYHDISTLDSIVKSIKVK